MGGGNKKVLASSKDNSGGNPATKRKRSGDQLDSYQKHLLAMEVSNFPCIWKVDDPNFQRSNVSEKAFDSIALRINATAAQCRGGWDSMKQALKYRINVKPKKKKFKSGEPADFDSEGSNHQPQEGDSFLENWEFYDSMKFYILQQTNKKRRTIDSFGLPIQVDDSSDLASASQDSTMESLTDTDLLSPNSENVLTDDEVRDALDSGAGTNDAQLPGCSTSEIGNTKKACQSTPSRGTKEEYSKSNYSYAWRQEKNEDKELNKGLLMSLNQLVTLRKDQVAADSGKEKSTCPLSLKYFSIYANLDRMLQKLPEVTVERVNLKFQQIIMDELDQFN